MPKKGIHPVMRSITYVLKNGASIELPSVLHRQLPYILQAVGDTALFMLVTALVPVVRICSNVPLIVLNLMLLLQDTTTNALWTGEKEIQTGPSGRSAKMMRRYERMGFNLNRGDNEAASKDAGQQPGAIKKD